MIVHGVDLDSLKYFDHSPVLTWAPEMQYWTWACMSCRSLWPWFCTEMPEYEGEDFDD